MKKAFSAIILTSLLILPAAGLAQTTCSDFTTETTCVAANCMWNPTGAGSCAGVYITSASGVITIINTIGNWIFAILLAVAGIMLVYAAFRWVTAGGDPQAVQSAKQTLINAVIGIVVALLAKGLVMAIVRVIGG